MLSAVEEGRAYFVDRGFDSASFWEQPIVWGDHDAFQYVITSVVFSLCLTFSLGMSIMSDMVHIDRIRPVHPGLPSPSRSSLL
jgi:hypothetical protein